MADDTVFTKHLCDEQIAAHQALDRVGVPRTKAVPSRQPDAPDQIITIGLVDRITWLIHEWHDLTRLKEKWRRQQDVIGRYQQELAAVRAETTRTVLDLQAEVERRIQARR